MALRMLSQRNLIVASAIAAGRDLMMELGDATEAHL